MPCYILLLFTIIGLREIQTRRFERQWSLIKVSCCQAGTENVLKSTDEIGALLALSDLHNFEPKLMTEGVTKIRHFTDVTAEDLTAIGIL